ncbi:2'-5' RNA ligase family protein [Streptococcus constellatus subsp. pharyngis]|uniref:Conserved domain protein n=1 Tax=Streptococcus constellatus subsp. pharyngis SK1060 = CCUG 46377 TaxID=1035184 RepID=F9P814_STRCV|nr:2'-5' RNA ligase family protein [Streptococcus constellatus]EGV08283.1 conserved domain protein [Streptococcus constellatus subsp. pharyngis SK1060 = CCUG 46377]QQC22575.1 2'-5' RNA ligase family protein [Streptococcus constellatus]QRP81156.1 2'-5' RNA ligase family protein [Streptococcus constellatus]GAD44928.1 hypothetical protein ANG5_1456 [Streptococcus constellatus subsp. pharyngis SK1060 = CCUG 46377]
MNFSSISSFLGSSIVTLNPVKTSELTAFHAELHKKIASYVDQSSSYLLENWVPHVTLANRVPKEKMGSALPSLFYSLSICIGNPDGIKTDKDRK